MKKVKKIWLDGRMVDWEKASVHVLSHSLHYGSGVFEGIRFYDSDQGPVIFRLREHIDRLFYSARAIGMKLPFTRAKLMEACRSVVRVNGVKSGYIRPLGFFGSGSMGLRPDGARVQVCVACWPWPSYLGEKPIRVGTSKFKRINPETTVADAKICGHYVNSILAIQSINRSRFDEALLLDGRGYVAEGPGANLFIVRRGVLYTPPAGTILPGITRSTVMQLAADQGLRVRERALKLKDLYAADEAFFVGTAAEVTIIKSFDGHKLPGGEIGPMMKNLYLDVVQGRAPKYRKWLTKCL